MNELTIGKGYVMIYVMPNAVLRSGICLLLYANLIIGVWIQPPVHSA
jgi:hypothetical protein